jgi:F1F0 ATPase subunit 2
MIESLVLAVLAGASLGAVFFLGLWWTVRKGLASSAPVRWFLLSFLLRMGIALVGFYWIAQFGQLQHLALALFAFIGARFALTRMFSAEQKYASQ